MEASNFQSIQELVYKESGMYFSESKMYFVDSRVNERMKVLNCHEIDEYLQFLNSDLSRKELENLVEALTTNETFFFRDMFQVEAFADEVLPYLLKKKEEEGNRTLRIWSAGCSTGEEPYTLAMFLLERIKDIEKWNIQILATDINQRVLSACRNGIYSGRSIKTIPPYFKNKYCTETDRGLKINYNVKKLIQFRQLNLSNQSMMRTMQKMDCIFCRNVLVYFDEQSAKKVISSFYDDLNPGGIIFLGYSESMHRFSSAFQTKKFKKAFAYLKNT